MTDFQPKNLNELESYLENLALREGPICFALFKSIQRIGHLSSPDVLEYVRIAQTKMAEAATTVYITTTENTKWLPPAQMTQSEATVEVKGELLTITAAREKYNLRDPLSEGDDERTLPGDPLPIAGNPLSGAEHLEMTPAQQRAARARAARQANLAARRQ